MYIYKFEHIITLYLFLILKFNKIKYLVIYLNFLYLITPVVLYKLIGNFKNQKSKGEIDFYKLGIIKRID